MALIKCPGCGKEISEDAIKCPKCEYPIMSEKKKGEELKIRRLLNARIVTIW